MFCINSLVVPIMLSVEQQLPRLKPPEKLTRLSAAIMVEIH